MWNERPAVNDSEQVMDGSCLTFKVGEELYGLDILSVREVLRADGVQHLPGAESPVVGLMELRGDVLPVVDLGLWLSQSSLEANDSRRLIVMEDQHECICLLVDEVAEVMVLSDGQADSVPAMGSSLSQEGEKIAQLVHFGDRTVMILDMERLVGALQCRS